MIDVLERAFQKRELHTRRQVPSRKGRITGYVDLLVYSDDGRLLLVEIEMSPKRALGDVRKREDFGERAILWIVVPTRKLAQAIKKHLESLEIEENEKICVLPFGAAMKRVLIKDPFCFRA